MKTKRPDPLHSAPSATNPPPHRCRDCTRPIRWAPDVKDPKGARCWDCNQAYRTKHTNRGQV